MNPEMIKWVALAIGVIFGIKAVLNFYFAITYEGSTLQLKDACQGLTRRYKCFNSFVIAIIAVLVWWFA